jgi:CBS domain-containing protein
MLLREMMTRSVEQITPQASIKEAAVRMREHDIGVLPVCEGNRMMGIITDRDIAMRAVAEGRDPKQTPVREAMTPNVTGCSEDDTVEAAIELMEQKQIRRVVVCDRNQRPVGIISLADIATRLHDVRVSSEVLEKICEPATMHA